MGGEGAVPPTRGTAVARVQAGLPRSTCTLRSATAGRLDSVPNCLHLRPGSDARSSDASCRFYRTCRRRCNSDRDDNPPDGVSAGGPSLKSVRPVAVEPACGVAERRGGREDHAHDGAEDARGTAGTSGPVLVWETLWGSLDEGARATAWTWCRGSRRSLPVGRCARGGAAGRALGLLVDFADDQ
jgi:hypothetical protein